MRDTLGLDNGGLSGGGYFIAVENRSYVIAVENRSYIAVENRSYIAVENSYVGADCIRDFRLATLRAIPRRRARRAFTMPGRMQDPPLQPNSLRVVSARTRPLRRFSSI